ncbi:MAG: ribonuclease III family protein [Candidatus Ranarchaeia archaeon]
MNFEPKRKELLMELAKKLDLETTGDFLMLLHEATTHNSIYNGKEGEFDYERLEFLGDSILGFIIAEKIFKMDNALSEGKMTAIRSAFTKSATLSKIGKSIDIDRYISINPRVKIVETIRENVVEALIGAIYIAFGMKICFNIINQNKEFSKMFDQLVHNDLKEWGGQNNPKNKLQEILQQKGLPLPEYRISSTTGPPHKLIFQIEVSFILNERKIIGIGIGPNKTLSSLKAAEDALTKIHENKK